MTAKRNGPKSEQTLEVTKRGRRLLLKQLDDMAWAARHLALTTTATQIARARRVCNLEMNGFREAARDVSVGIDK